MTIRGTVRNGKIELEPGAVLPEGAAVRVETVVPCADPADGLADEAVSTGISDRVSQHQHDHYICETTTRQEWDAAQWVAAIRVPHR